MAASVDITQQVHAEQASARARSAPDAVRVDGRGLLRGRGGFRLRRSPRRLSVHRDEPAFEKHTGLKGMLNKSMREAVPDLEDFWFETYGRVAKTGKPTRFVHQAKPVGNRWFDVTPSDSAAAAATRSPSCSAISPNGRSPSTPCAATSAPDAPDYAEATLRTSPVPLMVLEKDLRVHSANEAFYETFAVDPAQTEGRFLYHLGDRQWDIPGSVNTLRAFSRGEANSGISR